VVKVSIIEEVVMEESSRGTRVLVLEPHGDDALLSMFEVCKGYERGLIEDMGIVTMSGRSSEDFATDGGYATSGMYHDIPDGDFANRPTKHTVVNKLHREGVDIDRHFMEIARKEPTYMQVLNAVRAIDFCSYDYVVLPVGVLHLDHMVLRDVVLELARIRNYPMDRIILAADVPYVMRVYGKKLLDSALASIGNKTQVTSLDGSFGREKVKCLKDYYPTEVGFLVFDKPKVESVGSYYAEGSGLQFMESLIGKLNQYKEVEGGKESKSSSSDV
jgi:hypothetical protein